jgi:hypothetical protein
LQAVKDSATASRAAARQRVKNVFDELESNFLSVITFCLAGIFG